MANATQALTTMVESSNVDLAISGWLASHQKSVRTHTAYQTAIEQVYSA